jgi:hypothetical protein
MKDALRRLAFAALAIAAAAASEADVVYLQGGGSLEGRIVAQTETTIEVDIGAGSLSFPMSSVERVETGRSPLDDYDERAAALEDDDLDGWLDLARWASRAALGTQAKWAYEKVLAIDPDSAEANRALGRVEVDGEWMTEADAYRARGYVDFEGRWMTPDERDAIMRSREADQAEAQAQARTAEALAEAADARAREADAEAREAEARWTYQNPVYWGSWGPGPTVWPTNPLDRPRPQPLDEGPGR